MTATDHLNKRNGGQKPPLKGQTSFDAGDFGTLWLVWSDVGLVSVTLPGGDRPFDEGEGPPLGSVPAEIDDPLARYFSGDATDPASDIPVDLRGTDFQIRVWQALRRIPRGQVRTYAGIASDVGSPRAMRAVGMANAKNPLPVVVPCHRVVEKGQRLGGYSGGIDNKVFLLELEGVHVESNRVLPGQLDLL